MQTLTEIKSLLAARGLVPRHRFGQNFLHDHNQLRKLVDAAGVTADDVVLEVGPGTGTLTEALLERGAEVIACEIDRDLAGIVRDRLGDRVTLVVGDCLERHRRLASPVRAALAGRPFRLVANLPFQVASPLVVALLVDEPACLGQHVTIQREVADRLAAAPGRKAYGALTVIVAAFARVQRISTLAPGCFWPAPRVESAMVAITPRSSIDVEPGERRDFAAFVTRLFASRRKQLGTSLGRDVAWPDGVEPTMRPEVVDPRTMVALWRAAGTRPPGRICGS